MGLVAEFEELTERSVECSPAGQQPELSVPVPRAMVLIPSPTDQGDHNVPTAHLQHQPLSRLDGDRDVSQGEQHNSSGTVCCPEATHCTQKNTSKHAQHPEKTSLAVPVRV